MDTLEQLVREQATLLMEIKEQLEIALNEQRYLRERTGVDSLPGQQRIVVTGVLRVFSLRTNNSRNETEPRSPAGLNSWKPLLIGRNERLVRPRI